MHNGRVYSWRKADNNLHKSEIHSIIENRIARENNGKTVGRYNIILNIIMMNYAFTRIFYIDYAGPRVVRSARERPPILLYRCYRYTITYCVAFSIHN